MLAAAAPRLEPVDRRLPVPLWAAAVLALWLGEVAVYAWLSGRAALPPLCPLRAATGVPCPLCGSTRAALAAARGRFVEAFLLGPLFCLAVALAAAWLVLRVGFGRRLALPRPLAWAALAIAVTATWVYKMSVTA